MARRERPWWWAARRSYYVIVNGQRHKLGSDRAAAFKRWHEIAAAAATAADPPPHTPSSESDLTLGDLIDRYLAAHSQRVGVFCARGAKSQLTTLTKVWGRGRRVSQITHADFTDLVRLKRWAALSATTAKKRWAAVCNWAGVANPLRGLRTGRSRTRDLVLPSREDAERLAAAARPPLRDVIEALYDTGCRPIEVFSVTAADFVGDRWVLRRSKTGEPRVIHLTDRVRQRCEVLKRRYPTGPLYRRENGSPWPLYENAAGLLFWRLRRRLGYPAGMTLYSFRHAFATDSAASGVPESVICAQLGNTPAVLHRHYLHLRGRGAAVRDAVLRVRGGS